MSRLLYYSPVSNNVRDNIYQQCCKNIRYGKRVIYIAPSRELIFKVRKDITSLMGGLINMDVMSFDDLQMEILKGSGRSGFSADSGALSIILSGALEKLADKGMSLSFFKNVIDKPGFVEGCLRAIRRMKRSMVLPDDLKEIREALSEHKELLLKLSDLETIYREYMRELKRLRIKDSEDLAMEAVSLAGNSFMFSSMGLMVVDGFTDIDPINRELLRNIADTFPEADYICNIPFNAPSAEKFVEEHIIKDMSSMGFVLKEPGGGWDPTYASSHLEQLFSVNPEKSSDVSRICINNHPCIEDEVRGAARRIKQLVMSGEKPERMAVVITSDRDYRDILPDIFSEMGLPLDMGERIPLSSHPVARDLWTLLNLKANGMSLKELTGIVSSRYFCLVPLEYEKGAEEALSKLYDGENTMEALDAAAMNPESYGLTEGQISWARTAYSRAQDIISRLPDEGVIGEFVEKLTELLDSYRIRENLVRLYKSGLISSEIFIRDVKGHFSIMETLGGISRLYKQAGAESRKMQFREFASIIGESLRNQTITTAQREKDGIKVVKPETFRGVDYDYVFILGLNEGVYPKSYPDGGLFTIREREVLLRYGLDLGCRTMELSRSRIAFMLACCSAKKKLFLSYRTTGEDGSYMIKSPFLEELEGLYEKDEIAKVTGEKRCMRERFEGDPHDIWSKGEAIDYIIINDWQKPEPDRNLEGLRRTLKSNGLDGSLNEIYHLGEIEKNRQQGEMLDRYDGLIKESSTAQSSRGYCFSASQINSYASCPFRYYMENVLDIPDEEDKEEFSPRNEGTLYHEVLKYYYEDTNDLYTLDTDLLENELEIALSKINDKKITGIVRKARVDEIRNNLEQFLLYDIGFFKAYRDNTGRELMPHYLELKVNETRAFSPYLFTASIDRVDMEYEGDRPTGRYIMYDYKRRNAKGTKDCLRGSDFQLAVYYHCIQNVLKTEFAETPLECLGLMYYTIEEPNRDGFIREEYKKLLGKSKKQDTLGEPGFAASMEFLNGRIKELAARIASGDFALKDSCPMNGPGFQCRFRQACRFDRYRMRNKRR